MHKYTTYTKSTPVLSQYVQYEVISALPGPPQTGLVIICHGLPSLTLHSLTLPFRPCPVLLIMPGEDVLEEDFSG